MSLYNLFRTVLKVYNVNISTILSNMLYCSIFSFNNVSCRAISGCIQLLHFSNFYPITKNCNGSVDGCSAVHRRWACVMGRTGEELLDAEEALTGEWILKDVQRKRLNTVTPQHLEAPFSPRLAYTGSVAKAQWTA